MGYLGVQQDALDARITLRCGALVSCECVGGCGIPAGGSGLAPGGYPRAYYTGGGGYNLVQAVSDVLNFDTEIMAASPPSNLHLARYQHVGFTNGVTCKFSTGCYRIGGGTGPSNDYTNVTDDIPLATDVSSAGIPAIDIRAEGSGVGNTVEGFIIGGFEFPALTLPAEHFTHAVGVYSSLSGSLQTGTTPAGERPTYTRGETSNDTQGHLLGGNDWAASIRIASIDVITFATATVALSPMVSSVARGNIASTGNATVGVVLGGETAAFPGFGITPTDLVEKITYATSTIALAGSASLKIMDASATGTNTYAYLAGGYLGGVSAAWTSHADRFEYSTDTLVVSTTATLKAGGRSRMEAAGSSYF